MSVIIDARFAGGQLAVDVKPLPWDDARRVVVVTGPSAELPLQVQEARRLAVALLEAAAEAERPESAWPDEEGRD